ncbi:MAG: thioredoxin-disulfide reductase [Candidatus Thermoplasmatota archaeon]
MDFELAVVGAGPAGLTAGLYAERAGIKTILIDKEDGGGLAAIAPSVENYPGFKSITGSELMEKIKQHAKEYVETKFYEPVENIEKQDEKFNIKTSEDSYTVGAVIIATGTKPRKLDVEGEEEFHGQGVSYCATCDGFFFKDKKVAVVGGGNSALIEAIYLKQIGCKEVYLIHRRDQLRAEEIYEKEAKEKNVEILFNKTVEKIQGDKKVEKVVLNDTKTGEKTPLDVDGVFISIGEIPQNALAEKMNIKLDGRGYIKTDEEMRTNIKGVYAAGDITGGLRQIVTACSDGAKAGLSCTEVLGKQYPY